MDTGACILILSLLVYGVQAYPGGAPEAACSTMTPQHSTHVPQTTPSPFTVTAVATGQMVTVSVTGDNQYRGILLQARTEMNGEPMGAWTVPEGGNFQLLSCNGQDANALTHNSRADKSFPQDFTWTASGVGQETNFTVFVTVVQALATFHVMVPSAQFTVEPAEANTMPMPTTTPSMTTTSDANAIVNSFILWNILLVVTVWIQNFLL